MESFKVYFINFGHYSSNTASTLDDAKTIARKAGFQSRIDHNGNPVMSYCPIGGFRSF